MLLRILKAVVLAVVMYFSLRFLGFGRGAALIGGSIPLLLGVVNVFVRFAFGIAGICFVVAALSALLPEHGVDNVKIRDDMSARVSDFRHKLASVVDGRDEN